MTTPLSPAAQAVIYAFNDVYERITEHGTFEDYGDAIAAALRAAADQVVPEGYEPAVRVENNEDSAFAEGLYTRNSTAREHMLTIATELEGRHD